LEVLLKMLRKRGFIALTAVGSLFGGVLLACSDDGGGGGGAGADGGTQTLPDGATLPPGDAATGTDAGADARIDGAAPDGGLPPELLGSAISFAFNGDVLAAVHAKDAWYLGGEFSRADTFRARRAIALDLAGNPTPAGTCNLGAGFDGTVNAVVQQGSSVFFGGEFQKYRGQSAKFIAKVNAATCALDTSFSPPVSNGFDDIVRALAVSADGASVFVGGNFRAYRGVQGSAWYLAKLNATTGAQDATFVTSQGNAVDNPVGAFAVDGNTLYIGGSFTRWAGVNNSAINLAKVNATTGALDTTFGPTGQNANGFAGGDVRALLVSGSSLFVGGAFNTYRGVNNAANNIAKLNKTTGAIDTTFSPPGATANGFTAPVLALAALGNALHVGGDFGGYKGVQDSARRIAKLDMTSGALDTSFTPAGATANGFNGSVSALVATGSAVYAVGNFSEYRGAAGANAIAKLDAATGALDASFRATGQDGQGFDEYGGFRNGALALHLAGSTLWVGGEFGTYGGNVVNHLVRIPDATGKIDRTFGPVGASGFDDRVEALAADGSSLFVGGAFEAYRGVAGSARHIAKLDLLSGKLDTSFSPPGVNANGFNADVMALSLVGSSLYVGGEFNAYRNVPYAAFALAKLDAVSGAIDTTFSPPGLKANGFEDGGVRAIVASSTALYVGGQLHQFRDLGRYSVNNLAKLDLVNGQLDTTFSPFGETANGTDNEVRALALVGDSLFVGGEFSSYRGAEYQHIVKVNAKTGAPETSFVGAGPNSGFNGAVYALAIRDGALFAAGAFTDYRGVPASSSFFAKLDPGNGALDTVFTPTGATLAGVYLYSAVPYGPSIMFGGRLDYCDNAQCYSGAVRVNRSTGKPE
jgi:hypothetical protein